jgi:putative transposase
VDRELCPSRRHPARGVFADLGHPTIVFLTVCTKDRRPWLASPAVHAALRSAWGRADRWLVGRYIVMPDHVHLFCAPASMDVSLPRWIAFWKSMVTRACGKDGGGWQRDAWDTRLRRQENYGVKWDYVRANPVRAGLTARTEDWPYQGEMNVLPW